MSLPLNDLSSHYLSTWPRQAVEMARVAYELTSEEWPLTGQGSFHPNGSQHNIGEEIADRMVALLFIRLVALLTFRLGNKSYQKQMKMKIYTDFSTTTICRAVLIRHAKQHAEQNQDWESYSPSFIRSNGNDPASSAYTPQCPPFPVALTSKVIDQLRAYVLAICQGYRPSKEVPYHNVEHAYHVFLSANKLLDLMLHQVDLGVTNQVKEEEGKRPTYGIKYDPLAQLAFLFSALIHDVDHTGISNRQLVLESDDLAVLYNDQSVAEQRSLAVAFTTLKQPQYAELRDIMFSAMHPSKPGAPPDRASNSLLMSNGEDFFRFRKLVIDLVLATDIASPERTQIVKSKWKEAFGEVQTEKKRSSEAEKHTEKNVNFEPDVLIKEQQKLVANNKNLSDSIVSAASGLSLDTDYSDSASSAISVTDDDDFNQSSASSQKMSLEEVAITDSANSSEDVTAGLSKDNNENIDRGTKKASRGRRRRTTGPQYLSASTTSVPLNRMRNSRLMGLSRSMMSTSSEIRTYRHENRRLGVRRALDLAGSTIEAVMPLKRVNSDNDTCDKDIDDNADEFKATTCLEQMLRAADVAALIQDFANVRKWSTRLYKELNNGFYDQRGEDPKIGWFDNQIKFFDFYILPLAKNLGVTVS